MPNLNLITSKRDVFFATTAPEFFPGKCERIRLDSKPPEEMPCSPPPLAQTSSSSRSSFQSNVFSDFFAYANVETSLSIANHFEIFAVFSSKNLPFADSQADWKPIRIYRIPLQTLSRNTTSNCSQRRCPSPVEPEIVSAPPTASDRTFLSVETPRASRSCSSSPTPTPTTNMPSPCRK